VGGGNFSLLTVDLHPSHFE